MSTKSHLLLFVFISVLTFKSGLAQSEIVLKNFKHRVVLSKGTYLDFNLQSKPILKKIDQDSLFTHFWRIEGVEDSILHLSKVYSYKTIKRLVSEEMDTETLKKYRSIALDSAEFSEENTFFFYNVPDSVMARKINIAELKDIYLPKLHRGETYWPYLTAGFASLYIASAILNEDRQNTERISDGIIGGFGLIISASLFRNRSYGYYTLSELTIDIKQH